jgi:hypothetical protein
LILLLFSISSEILIIDSPDTSEINLGYSFIIENSDSLWCGEKLLSRGSAYLLDYQKGSLVINNKCSQPLKFKFSHLDFVLNESYFRWSRDTSGALSMEVVEDFPKKDRGELVINGNKGLFIDVRSGGSDISQSLWMKIGGNAGQFSVSGVLSDENIPKGDVVSQNLQEIDEIYIEAVSDNISFRMGDIVTIEEEVDKRLLGLSVGWKELSGVAGISKAKYGKVTFKTVEDKQGPYKISPEEGISGISIVRGSEQVWLNGELLERGVEKDYTINYVENALTFSSSVFLDNESVVLALFQYSIYGENSIFYKTAFEKEDYSLSFTREEDFSEKDLIETYPDSAFGYRYASVNVGEGNGDYEFQDSIFVYRGYKNGSYEVYFEWIGEGNGEYEYVDSLHYFLWTGDGPYSPKRKVPLGEEDNLFSFDVDKEFKNFEVSGNLKARRIEIPVGGEEKDGLKASVRSEYNPFDFVNLFVDYSKKTSNFVVREWEGEKDLLKTWETGIFPSDFLESGVNFTPNSKIEGSYTFGKADTVRKDKIYLRVFPLFFYWDNIVENRQDVKGGLRFYDYEISYRDLQRKENYRREVFAGSSYLGLLYGLEGRSQGDTARIYRGETNFTYKNLSFVASHIHRKNLISGQSQKITNGGFDINLNLSSFYLKGGFDISQKKASIWERYYQEVNPGEGSYSFDSTSSSYYENPYGDYVQRIVYTGEERDSREYSTNLSIYSDRIVLINGYFNSIYSPNLLSKNYGSFSLKFPEKSKNRVFFRTDFNYNNGEIFWGIPDRSYGKIDIGWENINRGYRELGLTREWSSDEDKVGGFLSFWNESGVEIKLEELLTTGEDTLISSILELGYNLLGGGKSGTLRLTLGYNYYPGGSVSSYRMNDLYPRGFFYDLTSSVILDLSDMIHLVINANMHKLSSGDIYYNGRVGVSADFSP